MERNKLYYPKEQIQTGLYTTGKEWMTEDGMEYVGFYHKYLDGLVLAGAVYNKFTSVKLIKFIDVEIDRDVFRYSQLTKNETFSIAQYKAPIAVYPAPVQKDYKKGKFTRYFLKRRNGTETDIIEIDVDQYESWISFNEGINENLYDAILIDWKLTGPIEDEGKAPDITYGVASTNRRVVELKNRTFKGIKYFLTDYLEWSIHSPLVSDDIKRKFVPK